MHHVWVTCGPEKSELTFVWREADEYSVTESSHLGGGGSSFRGRPPNPIECA